MLGRGLEALIPPQGNGPRQAQPEPELQAPQGYPWAELPAQPLEELLPPAQTAVPLMLHINDDEPAAAPSPYVQQEPLARQDTYADMRPESQGDTFSSQPYRYTAPVQQPAAPVSEPVRPAMPVSEPVQPAVSYQQPASVLAQDTYADMRPEPQGDTFTAQPYRYVAPVQSAPVQAPASPEPASPSYADMRPESQGDTFSSQPYRYTAPVQQAAVPVSEPVRPAAPSAFAAPAHEEMRQPHEAVFQIDIERIYPNPHQPRKTFDETALADLAASIREFGILQPLVVRKVEHETLNGTEVRYELIAGERRWRASKLVGLPRVPAIIRADVANKESLELAIIENLQREQLNGIEMARAYARLQDEFNMTQREVASRLGKSRETVANTLRLLDLPGDVQAAIEDGRISESHGRLLLGVTDPALQQSLFRDLLERQLTTRELRDRVAAGKGGKRTTRAPRDTQPLSPELQMLQERLASELGAPVRIQASGDTGKITISFYSREELSAILERLAAEADILL